MTIAGKPPCDEGVLLSGRTSPCAESAGPWILTATILGSSMAFIDGTVVNVALPALQHHLNATVLDVQWVVESYALFLAALLLVGGSLGDRFGRRMIYAMGIALFAFASAGCGISQSIRQLIVARAVQGIGAALLVPGSLAIISASFNEERRGKAIGVWSGFTAITAAIGPVAGGWLVEHVSWRAVFYINLPIAAIVLFLLFWRVPESHNAKNDANLDYPGAILATSGLAALVYGLIESSRSVQLSPTVVLCLIGGVVLLVAFLMAESRAANPMVPLHLFRSRNFRGTNLLTLFLYAALSGALFFLPLNLIQIQGYSATAAGAALLPFVFTMFFLSRWSGGLIDRYGSRLPLVVGPMIAAIGFLLFLRPGVGGSYWTTFFPAIAVLGLGMAISVAPLTTTVMNSVSRNQSGVASGINNAVSRTAGLLAIAVFGLVMLHSFAHRLDSRSEQMKIGAQDRQFLEQARFKLAGIQLPETMDYDLRSRLRKAIDDSFLFGFRWVMTIAATLAVASSLIAAVIIEGKSENRS